MGERRFTLRFWERRALCLTAKGVNDIHIDFRMLAGFASELDSMDERKRRTYSVPPKCTVCADQEA